MTKLKFAAVLCLLCGFAINSANSQAIVFKNNVWTFTYGSTTYNSVASQTVTTPSGKATVNLTFQLTPGVPPVPAKGSVKLSATVTPPVGSLLVDVSAILSSDGKLKVVIHTKKSKT